MLILHCLRAIVSRATGWLPEGRLQASKKRVTTHYIPFQDQRQPFLAVLCPIQQRVRTHTATPADKKTWGHRTGPHRGPITRKTGIQRAPLPVPRHAKISVVIIASTPAVTPSEDPCAKNKPRKGGRHGGPGPPLTDEHRIAENTRQRAGATPA